MKTITTIPQLTNAILDGLLDANLDTIGRCVSSRREVLQSRKRASLFVGDTVYFLPTTKPSYLAGLPAKIMKINAKRLVVDLFEPVGRFDKSIRTPLSIVTSVKP